MASGEFLIFVDDDAVISHDYLKTLFNFVNGNSGFGALCGKIIELETKNAFVDIFNKNRQSTFLNYNNYALFMGSSHILAKEIISRYGLYDEDFGVGAKYFAAEETEYLFRLLDAGEKVVYIPDLIYLHPSDKTPSNKKRFQYWYGFSAACAKHICFHPKLIFLYSCLIIKPIVSSILRMILNFRERDIYLHVIKGCLFGAKDYLCG